jgi:hypothetical protein
MTNMKNPVAQAFARIGGKATSEAKAAAARANGQKPCRPGKKRGWPKGKPRKPKPDPGYGPESLHSGTYGAGLANQKQKETKP